MSVTPEQLVGIPAVYRLTIARWLAERGQQIRPSLVCSAETAATVRDVMSGAAVDLMDPLAEDSTVSRANEILARLVPGTDQQ